MKSYNFIYFGICLVYLTLLATNASTATVESFKPPSDESMGTFPTNFMRDIVPKFKNVRPVIGVLTIVGDGDENPFKNIDYLKGKGYVGMSYVKFLESAGARVAPIVEVKHNNKDFGDLLNSNKQFFSPIRV